MARLKKKDASLAFNFTVYLAVEEKQNRRRKTPNNGGSVVLINRLNGKKGNAKSESSSEGSCTSVEGRKGKKISKSKKTKCSSTQMSTTPKIELTVTPFLS